MPEGQGRLRAANATRIGSAIDQIRDQKAIRWIDGEKVLRHGQAAYDGGTALHSSWKMGRLYLTPGKMVFFQGGNQLFTISVGALHQVELLERDWVRGRPVEQLSLSFKMGRGTRKIYLRMDDPLLWKKALDERLSAQGTPR